MPTERETPPPDAAEPDEEPADDVLDEPPAHELEGDADGAPSAELALPPLDGEDDASSDGDAEPAEPLVAPERALARSGKSDRALTRVDPLQIYIDQIRRYPLLTREEEHALAVEFVKTRDLESARRLVTANLRLVVKIAHEYRRAHRNLLDLIQEGNVGLVQAVNKYDPYRGVKLSSYAAWWIRAYMLKFLLNNWRLVKIGTTQAQRKLFFNLRKEKEKLEQMGIDPSSAKLAEAMQVPEREVIDMERRLGQGELSLDAPVSRDDDGGASHLDMLDAGGAARPEGGEFRAMLREKLEKFAATLRGRELTIFRERLLTDAPKTLQEIGDSYNISRERARQLEKRLVTKLKAYLREEIGDAVEIAMGLED